MGKIFKIVGLVFFCWGLYAGDVLAKSKMSSETKQTQVVIIGTVHHFHYKNSKYNPEVLKQIILSLKPDVILNELPLSQVDPNGRPLLRDPNKHPECWAADTVATKLGIKQIPFDMPDRQEYFKKTRHFERQKRADKLLNKWFEEVTKKDANSVDLKIAQVADYALQAQIDLMGNAGAELINSDSSDLIIKIKHCVEKDILPTIVREYPQYETLEKDLRYWGEYWQERNQIMADNITKAAKEYPGKRLVVVTGCEHRYILRDLLKNEESIELKEYWEVEIPEKEKQRADDSRVTG